MVNLQFGEYRKHLEKVEEEDFPEEGHVIVGGDFNIRIGMEGARLNVEDLTVTRRRVSKDKTISNGGRRMINFIGNKGWVILNGNAKGDEEGEFTFIGARGNSVIDYIIVNDRMWENLIKFKVEDSVDSDHAPV